MGDCAAASTFICSFLEYEKFLKMKVVQKPMCVDHEKRKKKILMHVTLRFDVYAGYIQTYVYIYLYVRIFEYVYLIITWLCMKPHIFSWSEF